MYRQIDQTQSLNFSSEKEKQSKVNSNGGDLFVKGEPSVSVLWVKICDKCIETVMCYSAHQSLDGLLPSKFFYLNKKQNTEKTAAQHKCLKNYFDASCN